MNFVHAGALPAMLNVAEAIGLLAFAVSGMIEARKRRLDAVGMFVVAFTAAFGGGTLRDVLLDRRPFYWVTHQEYTVVVFLASLFAPRLLRLLTRLMSERALVIADAVGLGLFSISGTSLALDAGSPPFVAVMMGVISAVFGGVLRDVLCAEMPMLLRDAKPYATCSFIGCWVYLGLLWLRIPAEVALPIAASTIFFTRMISLRLGWTLPRH